MTLNAANFDNGGRHLLRSLPIWLQAIVVLGLPSVLCLALLGVVFGLIPTPLLAKIDHIEVGTSRHIQASQESAEYTARLLRQICRNTARTEFGHDACNR